MIRRLIERWLEKKACKHKWELIEELNTYRSEYASKPHTITNHYKCTECGKFKKLTL